MAPAGVARPLPWGWPRPAPAARGAPSGGARRGGRARDDRMTTAPELLPRPRLMRSLAGVWKLASLTAPAGWGKTTVLAQWCSGRATLWVTATAAERDPAQLLGSFLASGSPRRPPAGRGAPPGRVRVGPRPRALRRPRLDRMARGTRRAEPRERSPRVRGPRRIAVGGGAGCPPPRAPPGMRCGWRRTG